MDLDKALEIMRLDKDYTLKKLEKKYSIMLKMYKNKEINNLNESAKIDDINEAYNILSNEISGINEAEIVEDSKLKKFDEFFYYHKFHIFAVIAAILLVVYVIHMAATHEKYDVRIAFQGYYSFNNGLQDEIKDRLKSVENPEVQHIYIDDNPDTLEDSAYVQKAFALLTSGSIDLYFVDKRNFETLSERDILLNLYDIANKNNLSEEKKIYKKNDTTYVTGIEVSESKFVKDLEIIGKEFIVCIIKKTKYQDNALKVINEILEE